MDNVLEWEFLNEPMTKWFIFLGVLIIMLTAWRMIMSYI